MNLNFSPIRYDTPLALERHGDVLTLNGKTLDLSDIPDGATLPAEAVGSVFVVGDITRTNGVLSLTLMLPHGANPPEDTQFPQPISVAADGPIDLPPFQMEHNNA